MRCQYNCFPGPEKINKRLSIYAIFKNPWKPFPENT